MTDVTKARSLLEQVEVGDYSVLVDAISEHGVSQTWFLEDPTTPHGWAIGGGSGRHLLVEELPMNLTSAVAEMVLALIQNSIAYTLTPGNAYRHGVIDTDDLSQWFRTD